MNKSVYLNKRILDLERPIISLDLEFSLLQISIYKHHKVKRTFKTFEILELGFLTYENRQCVHHYNTLVKPKFSRYQIDEKVKVLTGIEEADLQNGVLFQEAYAQLLKHYIPGKTYIATWGNGDLPVLQNMCEKNNLPFVIRTDDFIDISDEFHTYYQLNKKQLYSLEKTLRYLSIDHEMEHRAISDAKAAMEVLYALLHDTSKQKVESAN